MFMASRWFFERWAENLNGNFKESLVQKLNEKIENRSLEVLKALKEAGDGVNVESSFSKFFKEKEKN